ncbi:PhoH family protein [Portibacter lacus]|uniref:PhoH-like protein n=1 Tax=Portibacter lacus TaxID=1099794 RepID=A0AA37SRZ5_9BACT|nr:PhoH family protein [Portibacter lacus]GLR17015.1 phosphate starvation protein PhoH [Portibacter lacus]
MSEIILTIEGVDPLDLYGHRNSKLNLLKNAFPELTITSRGSNLKISGDTHKANQAKSKVEMMVKLIKEDKELTTHTLQDLLGGDNPLEYKLGNGNGNTTIVHGRNGKPIKAKTKNQKKMVNLSETNDIIFAIGPAGTGKTYTAVALAVKALKNKLVKKIILTRPAVEAGESLGFLPGDLKEKIDPYLRPLYDALEDMLPPEKLAFFMQNGTIEIAPLAYMRGRTLDNAFIILDEAQNTTTMQLKMFLTRLGPSAKCIITGDLSQVDLPRRMKSGLITALDILSPIDGIGKIFMTADDVVRHRLVKQIIIAYDKESERLNADEAQ